MNAIALWQPWASLWLSPNKLHETRSWPTSHRGWLAVHAAKRKVSDEEYRSFTIPFARILFNQFGPTWRVDLPYGCVLGFVNVIDCVPTHLAHPGETFDTSDYECGDFTYGRFGWRRSEYRVLRKPIPFRGMQGMFSVPDEFFDRECL